MKFIRMNLVRIRQFISHASKIGIFAPRILLWELPRVIVWRVYNRVVTLLYTIAKQRRWADKKIKRSLRQLTKDDGIYFYVIVVPQVLHFLIPAVRLVQQHVKVIFILNGISAVEENLLKKAFPDIKTIRLWTFPKSSWPHGLLLSLLLRNSTRNFGILDHDFFLFDPSVFSQLTFKKNEFAICVTMTHNSVTRKEFPGTHFLYLQVTLLREIMERYDVSAKLYKKIPVNVKPLIEKMGLSLDNPPKEYQSFFDSFLMLSALAMHDGFKIRQIDILAEDWAHLGGTSIGLQITKNPVHHFVSSRFIELFSNTEISNEYHKKIFSDPDKTERLRKSIDPMVVSVVDKLIKRLQSACTPAELGTKSKLTENNF